MLSKEVLLFLVFFIGSLIYWRVFIILDPNYFIKPFTRSKLGLRWHHIHYGMMIITLGIIMVLFQGLNVVTASLLGLGLGFTLDVFIVLLYVETERNHEIQQYHRSLRPTIYLFILVVLLVLISSIVTK